MDFYTQEIKPQGKSQERIRVYAVDSLFCLLHKNVPGTFQLDVFSEANVIATSEANPPIRQKFFLCSSSLYSTHL